MCRDLDTDADSMPGEDSSDKKKKKNKKKKKTQDSGATTNDQAVSAAGGEAKSSLESEDKQSTAKSSQVRTFSNGLVIEELAMGKPDGKRASPGSQVTLCPAFDCCSINPQSQSHNFPQALALIVFSVSPLILLTSK